MRYFTAGESHGPQLTAIIEGLPAGLPVYVDQINLQLARRQQGYGRGDRMKIEKDQVEILSGVRWGESIGSPVTLAVKNRDWENWLEKMSPLAQHRGGCEGVTRPRPGHADLAGAMKYGTRDIRNILERSSARETAARVAVGAVARGLLESLGIMVGGYVKEIGGIVAETAGDRFSALWEKGAASELFTPDPVAEQDMKRLIDQAKAGGDTVGGVLELQALGLPPGLGSHVQWDRKLDARLCMALMSIQGIKGVEVGLGFEAARRPGSRVHDQIFWDAADPVDGGVSRFRRGSNNAGGIEGGISNGEPLILRAAMKPIPTLYTPLASVDIENHQPFEATVERSDCCAVPAALVVAEGVLAIELVSAIQEKFGGDSLDELKRNMATYCARVRDF